MYKANKGVLLLLLLLSTPFPAYAFHHTANESQERLRFPEENDVSSTIAVLQRVVSIQSVDGVTGISY